MSTKHSALHTAEKKEGGWAGMAPHFKWTTIMLVREVTSVRSVVLCSSPDTLGPQFAPRSMQEVEGMMQLGIEWPPEVRGIGRLSPGMATPLWLTFIEHSTPYWPIKPRRKTKVFTSQSNIKITLKGAHKRGASNYLDLVNHATCNKME